MYKCIYVHCKNVCFWKDGAFFWGLGREKEEEEEEEKLYFLSIYDNAHGMFHLGYIAAAATSAASTHAHSGSRKR